jgi:hypothetical protein
MENIQNDSPQQKAKPKQTSNNSKNLEIPQQPAPNTPNNSTHENSLNKSIELNAMNAQAFPIDQLTTLNSDSSKKSSQAPTSSLTIVPHIEMSQANPKINGRKILQQKDPNQIDQQDELSNGKHFKVMIFVQ